MVSCFIQFTLSFKQYLWRHVTRPTPRKAENPNALVCVFSEAMPVIRAVIPISIGFRDNEKICSAHSREYLRERVSSETVT